MALLDNEFDAEETRIGEFLMDDPVTIRVDAGGYALFGLLSEKAVRSVIVVEEGSLAGILSLSNVAVLLGTELQHIATALRSSSPAYEQPAAESYDHSEGESRDFLVQFFDGHNCESTFSQRCDDVSFDPSPRPERIR